MRCVRTVKKVLVNEYRYQLIQQEIKYWDGIFLESKRNNTDQMTILRSL